MLKFVLYCRYKSSSLGASTHRLRLSAGKAWGKAFKDALTPRRQAVGTWFSRRVAGGEVGVRGGTRSHTGTR